MAHDTYNIVLQYESPSGHGESRTVFWPACANDAFLLFTSSKYIASQFS